jgi:hypothetical protein
MTLRLDYLFKAPKKDDSKVTPSGYIYVKTYRKDEQGHIFLTPDCMTKMEFEEAGESLIQEIKHIIKEGKKEYEN